MMKQLMASGLEVLQPPQPPALLSPCPCRQRPVSFRGKQHGGFRNLDSLGTLCNPWNTDKAGLSLGPFQKALLVKSPFETLVLKPQSPKPDQTTCTHLECNMAPACINHALVSGTLKI